MQGQAYLSFLFVKFSNTPVPEVDRRDGFFTSVAERRKKTSGTRVIFEIKVAVAVVVICNYLRVLNEG